MSLSKPTERIVALPVLTSDSQYEKSCEMYDSRTQNIPASTSLCSKFSVKLSVVPSGSLDINWYRIKKYVLILNKHTNYCHVRCAVSLNTCRLLQYLYQVAPPAFPGALLCHHLHP